MEQEKAIIIENLTKLYGEHVGVKNLNLSVDKGEIMGFLGPNGAGKTTTIRSSLAQRRRCNTEKNRVSARRFWSNPLSESKVLSQISALLKQLPFN